MVLNLRTRAMAHGSQAQLTLSIERRSESDMKPTPEFSRQRRARPVRAPATPPRGQPGGCQRRNSSGPRPCVCPASASASASASCVPDSGLPRAAAAARVQTAPDSPAGGVLLQRTHCTALPAALTAVCRLWLRPRPGAGETEAGESAGGAPGACAVCGAPASQCCSGCRAAFYCGRDHQRRHWRAHRSQCARYRVAVDAVLGRHLVAARDLRAGELVLREPPLALGPKISSHAACLGCLRRLREASARACSGCGWPVCGAACERAAAHRAECDLMRQRGFRGAPPVRDGHKESAYCAIAPLRCLLLKDSDPEKYKTLLTLQSHLDERRNTTLYTIFRNNVVGFVRDALGLSQFDDEAVLRVAAILDTNAFDVRREEGAVRARGLYAAASMLAHDCRPNTRHVFEGPDFRIAVLATVPIKKGDVISATYTQTLWGTLARRAHLRTSKCFDCTCARCADPTELGVYVGAISCSRCRAADRDSTNKIVSTQPLDSTAVWKCESCGHSIPGRQIAWGNDAIRQEIDALHKTRPDPLEDFLDKYSGALHPKNGHVLEVKYALSQMYGNSPGYSLADLTDEQVNRKVELCNELLEVADVLEPGMSRLRGILLYELQAAMVVQAKRDFNADKITKSAAQEIMGEAMTLLQDATKILQSEPDMTKLLEEKLEALATELNDD
ncbi:SET domain-containing protein SmydA-8 [Schistocerca gregaria]|uniref:SET domain-containing protein SmydA-8 n=1 Tax=Schistocerca gregaria TaxID=7010 RepID=UPI00211DD53D|nr:SET domain-containing protein SmydA-8 [Schistocerca gregaria]